MPVDKGSILEGAQLIFQGAESRIFAGKFLDFDVIFKERFPKKYRHPKLDLDLTRGRLRSEVRQLQKCRAAGIDCPAILAIRPSDGILCLERIQGQTLGAYLRKRSLGQLNDTEASLYGELPLHLGRILAQLHDNRIIHGDLTSSNVMLRSGSDSLVLIDFGLAATGEDVEDRAVDLYVLERAMQSTHADCADDFNARMFEAYGKYSKKAANTISRLEVVRARGRKKLAFG